MGTRPVTAPVRSAPNGTAPLGVLARDRAPGGGPREGRLCAVGWWQSKGRTAHVRRHFVCQKEENQESVCSCVIFHKAVAEE